MTLLPLHAASSRCRASIITHRSSVVGGLQRLHHPVEKKLSFLFGGCDICCAFEFGCCLVVAAESGEEVSADGAEEVVVGEASVLEQGFGDEERGLRSVEVEDGDGTVQFDHR